MCIVLQAIYKVIRGAKFGFLSVTVIWKNNNYREKFIEKG